MFTSLPDSKKCKFHAKYCEEILLPRDKHHNTNMLLDNLVKL